MPIKSADVTLPVPDGTTMNAYTSMPSESNGPFPGLLLFQEAFGVNHHIRNLSDRFAAEGYAVIAPELFHRTAPPGFAAVYTDYSLVAPHMQALNDTNLEADVTSAWNWLHNNPQVKKDVIASTGYCMGGRTSFLANTILPLKASVSYYGGRIAPDLVKRAPSLHSPVLFFWGGLDKNITHDQVESVMNELQKAGKTYINVEISDAGHGFFCDERASYHEQAARESWALTLEFLKIKTQ